MIYGVLIDNKGCIGQQGLSDSLWLCEMRGRTRPKGYIVIIIQIISHGVINILIVKMYCCGQCNLESEITITAVVLTAQNPNTDPRRQRLRDGFQPNKIDKAKQKVVEKTPYKYQKLLGIDKENNPSNSIISDISETKRKSCRPGAFTQSFLVLQEGAQTGRFNGQQLQESQISGTKRNGESKTTSFGSRRSSYTYLRDKEADNLREELARLRQEELKLQAEKSQREGLYYQELAKITMVKQDLKGRGRERFEQLSELKDLMRKRRIIV